MRVDPMAGRQSPEDLEARRVTVRGIVQGVGFRPFVYGLARRHGLSGEVSNTASGVLIHVEGKASDIESFVEDLVSKPPPLARITGISSRKEALSGFGGFAIAPSEAGSRRATLISPDMVVCQDCLGELFDPSDRRFRYPFINCTNCGPRYTIIADIPYDRPATSMKHFKMCADCRAEYDNPEDRRFHAQPNACWKCGPGLSLHAGDGTLLTAQDPVEEAKDRLRKGLIVAVKGLGGFHLAVDAENHEAVVRLRKRKRREEKPFAVMAPDLCAIGRFAVMGEEEKALLTCPQRPIVLLEKREPNPLSGQVAPGNRYVGVMLPYTPLHYLLLREGFSALVMTSANVSEEPICIDNREAFRRLAEIADFFLVHDRDIYLRSDDSVIRHAGGHTRFFRRSRGYVPVPVFLKRSLPRVLACGAELKNTVCLTREKNAFLSQHIGDLENLATWEFYGMTIDHLKRILDIEPEIVACDMHPDYLSTRYAAELSGVTRIPVQHHHAHVVSAMAENHLEGLVIGLSLDGTGYGTDGTIWGGEVLIAEESRFERAASFSTIPMPGGAAAIREPWRMAVSYLYDAFGEGFRNLTLPVLDRVNEKRIAVCAEMAEKRINSPMTSSLGRLFDGVAAVMGIRDRVAFEGQAAMELEMLSGESPEEGYETEVVRQDCLRILPAPIIRAVAADVAQGAPLSRIGARFHATLVRLFTDLCLRIRKETGLKRVVMSGGVFQNVMLLSGLTGSLTGCGFEVYSHREVPTNDGGISLGQAVAAAAMAGKGSNVP